MAAVNFERAWYELKAHVAAKRSHGQDELTLKMAELEVANVVPEGDEVFDARPLPASPDLPALGSAADGRALEMATH